MPSSGVSEENDSVPTYIFQINWHKSLLLVLCEFYIMHPNPTHFLLTSNLPFTPAISLPQKEKEENHCGRCSVTVVTHSNPLSILLCCSQMFFPLTLWSSTRPLASAILSLLEPPWYSSQMFHCCPVTEIPPPFLLSLVPCVPGHPVFLFSYSSFFLNMATLNHLPSFVFISACLIGLLRKDEQA